MSQVFPATTKYHHGKGFNIVKLKNALCLGIGLLMPHYLHAVELFANVEEEVGLNSYAEEVRIFSDAQNYHLSQQTGTSVLGIPLDQPTDEEAKMYSVRQLIFETRRAILNGQRAAFEDGLAKMRAAEYYPFLAKEAVFLIHNAVQAGLPISDTDDLSFWIQELDQSMGKRGWISPDARVMVMATQFFINGNLVKLEELIVIAKSMRPEVRAYVYWLVTRANPSDKNILRAMEHYEAAMVDLRNFPFAHLYFSDLKIRRFINNSGSAKEAVKFKEDLNVHEKALDPLLYPVLFGTYYKNISTFYSHLSTQTPLMRTYYQLLADQAYSVSQNFSY